MSDGPSGGSGEASPRLIGPGAAEAVYRSTFEHLQASYLANESMGEHKLQTYLTVLSAGAVAVGLVGDALPSDGKDGDVALVWAAAVACVLVFVLGVPLILRMAKRDFHTTEILQHLAEMRRAAVEANDSFKTTLPWRSPPPDREWSPSKGGLTFTLVLLNSVVGGLAVGCLVLAPGAPVAVALLTAIGGAAVAYVSHAQFVRRLYALYKKNADRSERRADAAK